MRLLRPGRLLILACAVLLAGPALSACARPTPRATLADFEPVQMISTPTSLTPLPTTSIIAPTRTPTLTPAPLLGATPVPPAIPTDAWVVENEGEICFQVGDNWAVLKGVFIPEGCFSSSCNQPIDVSLRILVDIERNTIRFFTRYVLLHAPPGFACTADCQGAGSLNFDLGELDRGTYAIWIGDKHIGELYMPAGFSQPDHVCFQSDQFKPAIPTPTATSLPTEPYPVPELPTWTPDYPAPEYPAP